MNAVETKVLNNQFVSNASQLKSLKTLFEELLADQSNA